MDELLSEFEGHDPQHIHTVVMSTLSILYRRARILDLLQNQNYSA